jgi:hypothetical protein
MQKYMNLAFVKLHANAEKNPLRTGGTVVDMIISYFFTIDFMRVQIPR